MKLSISLTHRETVLGWWYLLFSTLVLSSIIGIFVSFLDFSLTEVNILFFCMNFLCVIAIFHRFLWESLQAAWKKRWKCLLLVAQGFIIYFAATWVISLIIPWIDHTFSTNVNDAAILDLAKEHTGLFTFCIVFLVPVAEETLYRGLVFQKLYKKDQLLAYGLSTLLFAMIHVVDFIGDISWRTLLCCLLQYLPAGIVLAGVYESSGTIITSMLLHILINLIGMR